MKRDDRSPLDSKNFCDVWFSQNTDHFYLIRKNKDDISMKKFVNSTGYLKKTTLLRKELAWFKKNEVKKK